MGDARLKVGGNDNPIWPHRDDGWRVMVSDPHGYERLYRSMEFIAGECRQAGVDEAVVSIEQALSFATGSPSECFGEALMALRRVAASTQLPASVRFFATSLADEIRQGYGDVKGSR